jgi:hypothetical protein
MPFRITVTKSMIYSPAKMIGVGHVPDRLPIQQVDADCQSILDESLTIEELAAEWGAEIDETVTREEI